MLWLTGLTGLTKSCFSWLTSNQILWLTELTSNRKLAGSSMRQSSRNVLRATRADSRSERERVSSVRQSPGNVLQLFRTGKLIRTEWCYSQRLNMPRTEVRGDLRFYTVSKILNRL